MNVSVIIPSLDGSREGNLEFLREDLRRQTLPPDEVVVVTGVWPCSRAHNEGARRAAGEVLVFFDDDVRLGGADVVERLVGALDADRVGIAGAATLLPPEANSFQRHLAAKLPRSVTPVVEVITDSDMATHAGMAIRRKFYHDIGGEPEEMWRADDQVLRWRCREAGRRVVLAPGTWVYHPPHPTWGCFLRAKCRDGIAAAHDVRLRPDLVVEMTGDGAPPAVARLGRCHRAARFAGRFIRRLAEGNLPALAAQVVYATGYVHGILRRSDIPPGVKHVHAG
ncbi:MAG: glycosyltransferase [Planctomycetota bacterium]